MVSKCANPTCNQKFTYFGTGELLVKTSTATGHQELFWLCESCIGKWHAPSEWVPLRRKKPTTARKKAAAA